MQFQCQQTPLQTIEFVLTMEFWIWMLRFCRVLLSFFFLVLSGTHAHSSPAVEKHTNWHDALVWRRFTTPFVSFVSIQPLYGHERHSRIEFPMRWVTEQCKIVQPSCVFWIFVSLLKFCAGSFRFRCRRFVIHVWYGFKLDHDLDCIDLSLMSSVISSMMLLFGSMMKICTSAQSWYWSSPIKKNILTQFYWSLQFKKAIHKQIYWSIQFKKAIHKQNYWSLQFKKATHKQNYWSLQFKKATQSSNKHTILTHGPSFLKQTRITVLSHLTTHAKLSRISTLHR